VVGVLGDQFSNYPPNLKNMSKYSLKTLIEMPHIRPHPVSKRLKQRRTRIIDVNNYSGDFKRIIIKNIPHFFSKKGTKAYFLSIEIQGLKEIE
jgi:hypothetical protein